MPGTVAGMALALERYGTISLAEALEPAIELAAQGITVSADLAESLKALQDRLQKWPSSAAVFYKDAACRTSRARPWCRAISRPRSG